MSTSPSPCAHFGERDLFLSRIRRSFILFGRADLSERYGKSAFLCRDSRSACVLCLSLLFSLLSARRAAPLLPAEGRARTSGHTTHARSESRVSGALCVCLWFVCASFRDLARRAVRACALMWGKTRKSCFPPLVRHLAGLGGPWRPKKHPQTTTGLPYAAACFVKCVFSAVSKASFVALNSRWSLSLLS